MFTGLIQSTGRLARREIAGGSGRLLVETGTWDPLPAIGESVAVQGVCLTLAALDRGKLQFDVLPETLQRTNLGQKRPGSLLNLERALRVGEAMGGHMVTGHVDGVGELSAIERTGNDWVLTISCADDLLRGMVAKGSVACDGISLTIVTVGPDRFTVDIIPHTWQHTNLPELRRGDSVNLETDVVGKYVRRYLQGDAGGTRVTLDTLREAGFIS